MIYKYKTTLTCLLVFFIFTAAIEVVGCFFETGGRYWNSFGYLASPFGLFLGFAGLFVLFLYHIVEVFKEKFEDRDRIILVLLIFVVLLVPIFAPRGLVDCRVVYGKELFRAESEKGGYNNNPRLCLYESGDFQYTTGGWGMGLVVGEYKVSGDTIFFAKVRRDNRFYKFGIFDRNDSSSSKGLLNLYSDNYSLDSKKNEIDVALPILTDKLFWGKSEDAVDQEVFPK